MKYCNKSVRTMGKMALICCLMSLFSGAAFCATTVPDVTVLPVISEGSVTPARMAQRANGNIYVTDPHAEGVLVYSPVGKLVNKILTEKEASGIAFAKNGDLLVTQNTHVLVLNPDSGVEIQRFGVGTFLSTFAIAVDNRPTGTGKIFVTDIKSHFVYAYDSNYAPVDVSAGNAYVSGNPINCIGGYDRAIAYEGALGLFNRPSGLAIEKVSGLLAVVDSLNGRIEFFDQVGNVVDFIGVMVGYDPAHQLLMWTYPQSVAFEYTAAGALDRAYVLDTYQSYVMVLDATAPLPNWTWLKEIGLYGHHNGDLIVPSDILIDKFDPDNNRLLVTNGFGSISVFGLASLQPHDVNIDSITTNSMRVNWTNSSSSSVQNVRVYRSTIEGQLGTNISGDLPKTATSFTNNTVSDPLSQYTTYYYTVRAVDTSNVETSNISQVSAKTTGLFGLTVNINGSGQVNGTLACTSGACSASLASDSLVTLTATATGQSVFEGWTGDCFTTADTCLISMDGVKSVTAFFTAKLAFRVDGAYFDNLQDAYREAKDGSVIKVLTGTWPSTTHSTEYMTAWQAKSVTIEGGYDPTFTVNAGSSSTVVGRTNLTAGKVVMKQFKLK